MPCEWYCKSQSEIYKAPIFKKTQMFNKSKSKLELQVTEIDNTEESLHREKSEQEKSKEASSYKEVSSLQLKY